MQCSIFVLGIGFPSERAFMMLSAAAGCKWYREVEIAWLARCPGFFVSVPRSRRQRDVTTSSQNPNALNPKP